MYRIFPFNHRMILSCLEHLIERLQQARVGFLDEEERE